MGWAGAIAESAIASRIKKAGIKIKRMAKGKNQFVMSGLTLGQIMVIERGLKQIDAEGRLGPVGQDVMDFLGAFDAMTVDQFGDSHMK